MGENEVIHATPWDVRRFLVHESRRGRKYYAVYELLVVLRSFFDFLDLGGITTEIPLKTVRIRPPQLVPPHVISPRAIQRLVSAARNTRDAAIIELLYATGCRSSELVGIKFDDVDFELRKIRVTGKNNKVRYVVFGTRAASAVMTYLDGRKSGYLFQSTPRQKVSVYCADAAEKLLADLAGTGREKHGEHFARWGIAYRQVETQIECNSASSGGNGEEYKIFGDYALDTEMGKMNAP